MLLSFWMLYYLIPKVRFQHLFQFPVMKWLNSLKYCEAQARSGKDRQGIAKGWKGDPLRLKPLPSAYIKVGCNPVILW